MPLYGYIKDPTTTVVGAALNKDEFAKFYEAATEHFVEKELSDVMMHLIDPEFEKFRAEVAIFTHTDAAQAQAFINQYDILIGSRQRAIDRNSDMVDYDAPDPYLDDSDGRTIAEIHGLDKDDKWDKRTDEQKAADEELKKHLDELKKKGELSNDDSFAPAKKEGGVYVNDIRASVNADGTVQIDGVFATKVEAEAQAVTDDIFKQLNDVVDGPEIKKIDIFNEQTGETTTLTPSVKPNGFLYAFLDVDNIGTCLSIVSESFWLANGHLDDQHQGAALNLPDAFDEIEESNFIAHDLTKDEARKILNGLGFRESKELGDFLNGA